MAYLNEIPSPSEVRQPRSVVRINDVVVPNFVSWSIESNTFYQADTFHAVFAGPISVDSTGDDWFSTVKQAFIEIFVGFPSDPVKFTEQDLKSMLYGRVDDIEYDPVQNTITLTGRDLTAAFIDTKVSQQFNNQTSSQIAATLAASHGIASNVTPTTTFAGKYFQIDHVRIQAERSEWDVLAWLAAEEGYVVFMDAKTLYFGPDPRTSDTPYMLKWMPPTDTRGFPVSNVKRIQFSRSLTVAKGIAVVVHSWNDKQKKGFDAYYPSKPKAIQAGKASPFGDTQTYEFNIKGLQQQEAVARATQLYNEIVKHEIKLRADLPGDNLLTPRVMIQTDGFIGSLNQMFYVDAITREFSLEDGYAMSVRAKNHNPDLQVSSE